MYRKNKMYKQNVQTCFKILIKDDMSDIYKSPESVMVELFDLPIVISKKFVHFPVGYETSLCNFISHKLMLVFK